MRADNRGEGGIFALTALALRATPRPAKRHVWIIAAGLIGAALFYGDGVITPAISVLSAVEGLKVATPLFEPYVVPIALVLLVGLFLVQRRGTGRVGGFFGPVMLLWFAVLALLGLCGIIARSPHVLRGAQPDLRRSRCSSSDPAARVRRCSARSFLAVTGPRRCTPTWGISAACRSARLARASCSRRWC